MPTNRVPISRLERTLTATEWRFLTDEPEPAPPEGDPAAVFYLDARALWEEHRDAVMMAWARQYPGTRPSHWWRWDAPRLTELLPGMRFIGTPLCEPRRRLGGTGTPAHERGDYPAFDYGMPLYWLDGAPDDPPLFEAEAAYLERHGLMLRGERRRLKAQDFEPERMIGYLEDSQPSTTRHLRPAFQ